MTKYRKRRSEVVSRDLARFRREHRCEWFRLLLAPVNSQYRVRRSPAPSLPPTRYGRTALNVAQLLQWRIPRNYASHRTEDHPEDHPATGGSSEQVVVVSRSNVCHKLINTRRPPGVDGKWRRKSVAYMRHSLRSSWQRFSGISALAEWTN